MKNPIFKNGSRIRSAALIIITTALLLLIPANRASLYATTGCDGCSRVAALKSFVNVHAPQYEKQLEEWNKCMQGQLGSYSSFDPNDPKVKQAMEHCTSLVPDVSDYMFPSSVVSKLAEVLTSLCFHIVLGHATEPPDYVFRGSFDTGIIGEKNARGQDIKSRFTLGLYYNGDPVELVKRWTTESTLTTVSSQYNRMFDNRGAEIRREGPIENLLRDFERQPVSCEVRLDGGDETVPGVSVDVALESFKDEKGRPSREFNRVVVEAKHGRISGGVPVGEGASRQAFRIGEGTVRLQYLAPMECNPAEDEITVYSSCDILDSGKQPMEKTRIYRKIASRKIKLICAEGVLTFSYLYQSPVEYKEATIEIGLGQLDFSLPYGMGGNWADYHPILFMKIRKAKAWKEGLPGHGFHFFPLVEQTPHHLIVTNPKSRKVVGVFIWNNLLMFNWSDGTDGYMIQGCAPNFSKPTEGDGVIKASGGCTRKTPDGIESFKWILNRIVRSRK